MSYQNALGRIAPDVLRTFMLVAETGSFTQAAKCIFRTQAAASLQVKRLETAIGDAVFIRQGRGVALTQKGTILYEYARRILDLYDETVTAVDQPELNGRVRLGAPDDFATQHLAKALKRFVVAHPMVELDVVCDDTRNLTGMLENGRLDLAITTRCRMVPHSIRLDLVWIMSELMKPPEHDILPLALFHSECCYCTNAEVALAEAGREYRTAYRSPSLAGVIAAVQAGIGVAPVTRDTKVEGCRHASVADGLPDIRPAYLALRFAPGCCSEVVSVFAGFIGNEMGLGF